MNEPMIREIGYGLHACTSSLPEFEALIDEQAGMREEYPEYNTWLDNVTFEYAE